MTRRDKIDIIISHIKNAKCAGLAERSKAAVLKTVVPLRVPGVRIPKPAPKKHQIWCFFILVNCVLGAFKTLTTLCKNGNISNMRKQIFLFLDWSMTIDKLIVNEKIDKNLFQNFFEALVNLENVYDADINFLIVSGCSKQKAILRSSIIHKAFEEKKRTDMFKGFAYEYGGFFIDGNGKFFDLSLPSLTDEVKSRLNEIAKKCKLGINEDYTLYTGFEAKNIKQIKKFEQNAKNILKILDTCKFNDRLGCGIDVKDKQLNKGNFVKWYLKNIDKKPYLTFIGGDDEEDLLMLEQTNSKKIFIAVLDDKDKPSLHVSTSNNVLGVIDVLNNFAKVNLTHYMIDVYNSKEDLGNQQLFIKSIADFCENFDLKQVGNTNIVPYYNGKVKEDAGISLFTFLEPIGHITIHNFECLDKAYIDIFTDKKLDCEEVTKVLEKLYKTTTVDLKIGDFNNNNPKIIKNAFGPHFIVGYINGKQKYSSNFFKKLLKKLPKEIKMTPITKSLVLERDETILAIRLIAESHISFYYVKSLNLVYIDIFSCVLKHAELIKNTLKKYFKGCEISLYIRGEKNEKK